MKKILLLCIFLAFSTSTMSQYFDLGQDPSSFRWKQLRTKNFRVIYPEGADSLAFSLASSLQYAYPSVVQSLNAQMVKVSVILHPASVTSNAMVPLAPARMEFYTCPPQDAYAQPWLDQLVLHELRHLAQIERVNRKFTRAVGWVFGQQGTAAMIGLFVPFWFLEGDAVYTETVLGNAGRGRDPAFEMEMRAALLENGVCSFEKTLLGSYKDYLPDHYVFGYHMVAAARRDYGPLIWENALHNVAGKPFLITPFNRGVRQLSGLSRRKLYNRSFTKLRTWWLQQEAEVQPSVANTLTRQAHGRLVSFTHARYVNDSSIFYVKGGMDEIKSFRLKARGEKEKKIVYPGRYDRISFSAASGKLCWDESRPHPRWEQRSWSVVMLHDIESGKTRKLTSRSRFFAPALSTDGSKVAAVENDEDGRSRLVIMDAENGNHLASFEAPDEGTFMTPAWMPDGKQLVMISLNREGKTMLMLNTENGNRTILIPATFTEISHPYCTENYIFFSAAFTGIMNIYALRIRDLAIHRITNSRFGAFWPAVSPSSDKLCWSDYGARGFNIAETNLDTNLWIPLSECRDFSVRLFESHHNFEAEKIDFSLADTTGISIRKYSQLANAFNIHSWGPVYIDADNMNARPGVQFMSQNLLSNLSFSAGYEYNIAEDAGGIRTVVSWKKWFPVMDLGYSRLERSAKVSDSLEDYRPRWQENVLRLSVRIPLNLSSGRYYRYVEPTVSGMYYNVTPGYRYPDTYFSGEMRALRTGVYAYSQVFRSEKDIYPRWAQYISATFQQTPGHGTNFGSLLAAESGLYFPGLMNHHSFSIYMGYQKTSAGDYRFAGLITAPRGLKSMNGKYIALVKTSYDFPLCYPDFRIASIFYLKRIRTGLFFDAASSGDAINFPSPASTGITLLADFHLLRILLPITAGARISYLTGNNKVVAEFVYNFSLGIIGARKASETPADFRNRNFER